MPAAQVVAEDARPDERVDVQVDDLAREVDVDRLARDAERARPGVAVGAVVAPVEAGGGGSGRGRHPPQLAARAAAFNATRSGDRVARPPCSARLARQALEPGRAEARAQGTGPLGAGGVRTRAEQAVCAVDQRAAGRALGRRQLAASGDQLVAAALAGDRRGIGADHLGEVAEGPGRAVVERRPADLSGGQPRGARPVDAARVRPHSKEVLQLPPIGAYAVQRPSRPQYRPSSLGHSATTDSSVGSAGGVNSS